MAWIRLDDQIVHHPKVLKAGLSAWFWVASIAYSQRFLTDGFVPEAAIPSLCGVVDKPMIHIRKLIEVGLLEKCNGGFQVHDYLDFNESAADVRARKQQDRNRKKSNRNTTGIQPDSGRIPDGALARARAALPVPVPIPSISNSKDVPEQKQKASTTSNGNGVRVFASPNGGNGTTDQVLADRAARFVERYAEMYPTHRKGARYHKKPALDYAAAVELCTTWTDDAYLERLAKIFLITDHPFAEQGSRTVRQFAALASWCDGRLREVESGGQ